MFDIGILEFLVLGILALFIFGPERLPEVARKAARGLRQVRQMATNARRDLADELGPEFQNVDLSDLRNPRGAIKKYVLDGIDEDDVRIDKDLDLRDELESLDRDKPSAKMNGSSSGIADDDAETEKASEGRTTTLARREPPPFDPDAT